MQSNKHHATYVVGKALDRGADIMVVCMSSATHEDRQAFPDTPVDEPDRTTLHHWLRPFLVHMEARPHSEIIVIFCNRSGAEGEDLYAGTSAVVGIRDGVLDIYGLAGRGTDQALFADTNKSIKRYAWKLSLPPADGEESPTTIPTPTAPSPTSMALRPQFPGQLSDHNSPSDASLIKTQELYMKPEMTPSGEHFTLREVQPRQAGLTSLEVVTQSPKRVDTPVPDHSDSESV